MKKILLLVFAFSAFASEIINYNIYKRENRLDVMLSFAAPYHAEDVRILRGNGYTGVVLGGAVLKDRKTIDLNLAYADKLLIYPSENATVLEFRSKDELKILSAITKDDAFGLRIRVLPKNTAKNIEFAKNDEEIIGTKYLIVVAFMLILIAVLFVVKNKLNKKIKSDFKSNLSANEVASFMKMNANEVKILCEKELDLQNRFVVIEHQGAIFRLVIGTSNIWLDKEIKNNDMNFTQYYNENKAKISQMLKQNALENYKKKLENSLD